MSNKHYLVIEDAYLDQSHKIGIEIRKHQQETGCPDCYRFLIWRLNPNIKGKKPRIPSCRHMIVFVKRYLSKLAKANFKRTVI